MTKQLSIILLIILAPVISNSSIPSKWDNPTYLERIYKREVITFASIDETENKKHLKMEGAGITRIPIDKALEAAWADQCWEKHITAITKIKPVKLTAETKIVDMDASVLRFFWLKSRLRVKLNKKENQMEWEFIDGDFKGLVGFVKFYPHNNKTFVLIKSDLIRPKISIPAIVAKFALAMAFKQAGWGFRKLIEADKVDPCLTTSS